MPSNKKAARKSPPKTWYIQEIEQLLIDKTCGSEQAPVLKIEVVGIKDRLARFRDAAPSGEPPTILDRPSEKTIHAACAITIWNSGSGSGTTLVEQTQNCEITPNTLTEERSASILMEEPFMVHVEELQARADDIRTEADPRFAMQLVITTVNLQDDWPPVKMRIPAVKDPPIVDDGKWVQQPLLVAKWHKLPRVPESEQESILDLYAVQNGQKYKPKLGLKIEASWCAPPTPLELANAERRKARRQKEQQPVPRNNEITDPCLTTVEWQFEGGHEINGPELRFFGHYCPLCSKDNFTTVREYHMHLVIHHGTYFLFGLTYESGMRDGRYFCQGLVKVRLSDVYQKSGPDEREFVWRRPKFAFDVKAFLEGDTSWLGGRQRRLACSLAPPNPRKPDQARSYSRPRKGSRSNSQQRPDIPLPDLSRPPHEIPDIDTPEKRKFRVPKAPQGVQFFRGIAKRPLEEGELVSESDNEIDEEWLLQKHAETIDSFSDTTKEEKEFIQKFDRHMLKENLASDLHMGEALVRFCRRNRPWLRRRRSMKLEFHKKAATLKMQGCLGSKIILACNNIMNEPDNHTSAMDIDEPESPENQVKNHRTADYVSSDILPKNEHSYGRCAMCKGTIHHPRACIRCINPFCTRPEHHLECAQLEDRPGGWLCPKCRANTPLNAGAGNSPSLHATDRSSEESLKTKKDKSLSPSPSQLRSREPNGSKDDNPEHGSLPNDLGHDTSMTDPTSDDIDMASKADESEHEHDVKYKDDEEQEDAENGNEGTHEHDEEYEPDGTSEAEEEDEEDEEEEEEEEDEAEKDEVFINGSANGDSDRMLEDDPNDD